MAGMIFLLSLVYIAKEVVVYTVGNTTKAQKDVRCVVIDAGHGGDDPGKVGINGAKEKDINFTGADVRNGMTALRKRTLTCRLPIW